MRKSKVNVAEAARLYNGGSWTYGRLAAKYGVTRERIRQKLRGLVTPRVAVERTCRRCENSFRIMLSRREVLCGGCRHFVANYKQCKCGRWCDKRSKECRECANFHKQTFDGGLAAALYREGYGVPDIAAHLGAKSEAIYKAFCRKGVQRRPATVRVETARAACERMPIAKAAKRLQRRQTRTS